jgi:hypothetical protein
VGLIELKTINFQVRTKNLLDFYQVLGKLWDIEIQKYLVLGLMILRQDLFSHLSNVPSESDF